MLRGRLVGAARGPVAIRRRSRRATGCRPPGAQAGPTRGQQPEPGAAPRLAPGRAAACRQLRPRRLPGLRRERHGGAVACLSRGTRLRVGRARLGTAPMISGIAPNVAVDLAPGRAGGLRLRHPVLVASGGAGFGSELLDAVGDLLPGAIVTRSTTRSGPAGGAPRRAWRCWMTGCSTRSAFRMPGSTRSCAGTVRAGRARMCRSS